MLFTEEQTFASSSNTATGSTEKTILLQDVCVSPRRPLPCGPAHLRFKALPHVALGQPGSPGRQLQEAGRRLRSWSSQAPP